MTARPLHIAHVIYALKTGGLENGLVNLINRLPAEQFRHTIICLTDYDDFARRINRDDVQIIALYQQAGHDWGLYLKLYRLFCSLDPDIVHTRNLATLEAQIPAWLARVPSRVHGEHGRDNNDPDGTVIKYQWLRRVCALLIHRFIALSAELEKYLHKRVGISGQRISRICNGVDTERFRPKAPGSSVSHPFEKDALIIGYVGRMDAVKDPLNLVKAFIQLHQQEPESNLKLIMVGEGAERPRAMDLLGQAELCGSAWLPGNQEQVSELMKSFDIYVLPSIAEGISNTLLEAMATGLPVIATQVGGNAELVVDGETGILVDREDPGMLREALETYIDDKDLRERQGKAGRTRVETEFSLNGMVTAYRNLYMEVSACK